MAISEINGGKNQHTIAGIHCKLYHYFQIVYFLEEDLSPGVSRTNS